MATKRDLMLLADRIADEHGLDRTLFRALVQQESGWNPRALSPKGAQGLGQLMPGTARALGVRNPFDPEENLRGAARYLRRQLDTFGDEKLALAAYNAGPGAVRKHGGIPPYAETRDYVVRITERRGPLASRGSAAPREEASRLLAGVPPPETETGGANALSLLAGVPPPEKVAPAKLAPSLLAGVPPPTQHTERPAPRAPRPARHPERSEAPAYVPPATGRAGEIAPGAVSSELGPGKPVRPRRSRSTLEHATVALGKLGDFIRGAGAQLGTEIHRNPQLLASLLSGSSSVQDLLGGEKGRQGEAVIRSVQAGIAGLRDTSRNLPPAFFTNALGLNRGDPGYLGARLLDYGTDWVYNAGDTLTGKGIARVTGPAVGAAGTLLARGTEPLKQTRPIAAVIGVANRTEARAVEILEKRSQSLWARLVGKQKALWLSRPSTQIANIMGNVAAMEIALKRNFVSFDRLLEAAPAAAREAAEFWRSKGKRMSDNIREFSQYSGAFHATFVGTTVLDPIAPRPTRNPFLAIHGGAEQLGKLALFIALKPQLGAQRAAQEVEKHLFDYGDRLALLEAADRVAGLWVFNAYPLKAAELFLDTLIHRPDLVARYPRLQEMLQQEFPGSRGAMHALPPYQRGPFTLPVGDNRFLDVQRHHTFGDPFDLAEAAGKAVTTGRLPRVEPKDLLSKSLLSSTTRTAGKVQEEVPLNLQWRRLIVGELLDRVPALKDGWAVYQSTQGKARHRGGARVTPGEAVTGAGLGFPVRRAP